ncbi:histone-like protein DNA-binding protein [Leptolyngbya boryana NIES-2135]|jgi:DNA-binding protein HU-beta|uniref:Histone-like protein DNA-binding protein n=1 Tax=Leptolyngbya boryana NIES-2135 TaxID=1973484 RepID=A0A1Z4JF55_LEPBY|nr:MULTISPECIES: HU family DNA-binding protein [Leptolyngbya]BAY55298.1 histone-like protein DNA-binding protein [Leptolyngbya boryana NIES-2135]MBD2369381.1 HU family DNA-binding protein [Leptolyngbya sp. FACHB-161]MBD2375617.1 HU family DNA-binding protein [Leptolyngbya sp. FACHB-238]MBD2401710.1 HU family DNA-binding protein [Leptolyngbya sp. FACHB-239]MBD2406551.1 HU family DNA-binding protein [Leptolyngbya sp. FACHB-402]
MNRAELIDAISAKVDGTKKDIDAIVGAAIDTIAGAVADGDKVTIVGFGTFEARDRQAREGRNPKTGEALKIPATRVPAFSAGKAFKERVAN